MNQETEQSEAYDQEQSESVSQQELEEPESKLNSKGLSYYLFEKKYH